MRGTLVHPRNGLDTIEEPSSVHELLMNQGECLRTPGNDPGVLIFVVGNSRSGTTMVGRILGRHPAVFMFPEIHFFEEMWTQCDKARPLSIEEACLLAARLLSIQRRGYLARRTPEQFLGEAREMVTSRWADFANTASGVFELFLRSEALRNGKSIPLDQTPRNLFYMEEILDLYPRAKIIHMVRDPRDVLLSQKHKWRRRFLGAANIPLKEALRSWVNYHPITISRLWKSSVDAAARFKDHDRVFSLRFEDLLENPETTVRQLCHFSGISYEPDMLSIPQVGSSTRSDASDARGIRRGGTHGWQKGHLHGAEIYLCERICGKAMKKLGYDPEGFVPETWRLVYYCGVSFAFHLVGAFVLNLGRMRDIGGTLRKRLVTERS